MADDERSRLTPQGREFSLALWEFIALIANSLVFLLIGISLEKIRFLQLGFTDLAAIIILVLLGRAAGVYPLCWLIKNRTARLKRRTARPLVGRIKRCLGPGAGAGFTNLPADA